MNPDRLLALVASIAVALAVGVGLYLGGTPAEQRLIRFDERRVHHLGSLAYNIQTRWENSGSLPESLDTLADGQLMSRLPLDPETGAEYGYEIVSEHEYRLCAVFARPSSGDIGGDFWAHAAGYHCFEFSTENGAYPRGIPPIGLY